MANKDTRPMVVALFPDRTNARQAYAWLIDRGYTDQDLSVLMSVETREYFEMVEREQAAAAGTRTGGGVALGAAIGAIAGVAVSVALPGLGLVVAGPVLAGLAGASAGIVTGGLVGGMMDLSIPESYATEYEQGLRAGGVVLGVLPREGDADAIKDRFGELDGQGIHAVE